MLGALGVTAPEFVEGAGKGTDGALDGALAKGGVPAGAACGVPGTAGPLWFGGVVWVAGAACVGVCAPASATSGPAASTLTRPMMNGLKDEAGKRMKA